jgi:hypothetical protein
MTFGTAPSSGPAFAVGGRFDTVTMALSEADPPRLSTTVSVAVYVPAAAYACVGVSPDPVPPSPNVQLADAIVPSGSRDAEPFSVIVVSVCVSWSAPALAIGSWFGSVVLVVVGVGELVVLARLVLVDVEVVATVVVDEPVPMVAVVPSLAADHAPRLSWTQSVTVKVPVVV